MGFACDDREVEEFIDFSVDQALDRSHTTPNFYLLLLQVCLVKFCLDHQKKNKGCIGIFFERKHYL